jgi:hypothetical protein
MASISDLLDDISRPGLDAEYRARMLHPLPKGKAVSRESWILEKATKAMVETHAVLNIGSASGLLHGLLCDLAEKVGGKVYGLDKQPGADIVMDLDDVRIPEVPVPEDVGLVVIGEVLEHLSNPGWFLERLRKAIEPREHISPADVAVTVPNAFSRSSGWLNKGLENVNVDHVAWYSPRTLRTLVERAGYTISEWGWYNGTAPHSEGICALMR